MDRQPRQFGDDDILALKDLAAMVEHELAAVQLATRDPLSDLANRRGFLLLAEQVLRFCRRQRAPLTLGYLDLDDFKTINDTYGHAEGDRALVAFAEQLRATPGDMDVVGRLGGDEFAILLVQATVEQAEGVVARIQSALEAADRASGRPYAIAFSHGIVAFVAKRHPLVEDFLAESDERMYSLKRSR